MALRAFWHSTVDMNVVTHMLKMSALHFVLHINICILYSWSSLTLDVILTYTTSS